MRQTVYDHGKLTGNVLYLDGKSYPVVIGKHEIWVPDLPGKIIWTHNGEIEAYRDWDKGRNKEAIVDGTFNDKNEWYSAQAVFSILNEVIILRRMAELNMTPEIGDLFHIRLFTSDWPYGVEHCDVKGRFGFYMKPASNTPGQFSIDLFKQKILTVVNKMPSGAEGDLTKVGNVINGWCVDIRRTIWSMMEIDLKQFEDESTKLSDFISQCQIDNNLIEDVKSFGQFPAKQRKSHYQSYYLRGEYMSGSRDTLDRFNKMKLDKDYLGKTVLDLGSQVGSFCFEMWRRGARKIVGIDNDPDYVTISRRIARANGMQINFVNIDLYDTGAVTKFANAYYDEGVHLLLALSLYKHIGGKLFDLINGIKWEQCLVESNNCPAARRSKQAKEIESGLARLMKKMEYVGTTNDRSVRCVWALRS